METEIARKLYEIKYKTILSYDRYMELLERGLKMIQENGLTKKYGPTEQNALEVGLDYITEEMLIH